MMNCGLYLIENKITGDYYGGSSVRLKQRWGQHKRSINSERLHCPRLHAAMKKYGVDNFEFKVLLYCDSRALSMYEQLWLNQNVGKPNCYNIAIDAECAVRGVPFSDEHKQNISKALMGHSCDEMTRQKISRANTGKKRTQSVRNRMSESRTGHPRYENQVAATIKFNKSRVWSDETRQKISVSKKLGFERRRLQKELSNGN